MAVRQRPQNPQNFAGTQFIAHIEHTKTKFDAFGNMEVVFVIPRVYRDEALELLNASAMPVSVDVQRWREYDAAHGDRS